MNDHEREFRQVELRQRAYLHEVQVQLELQKLQRAMQDRCTFFLLAASGAAIGFAITRTHDGALAWQHAFVGIAIVFWALSFYFGYRQIVAIDYFLLQTMGQRQVAEGMHPAVKGKSPKDIVEIAGHIQPEIDKQSEAARRYYKLQFLFFALGALAYIAWHVTGMYLRTS